MMLITFGWGLAGHLVCFHGAWVRERRLGVLLKGTRVQRHECLTLRRSSVCTIRASLQSYQWDSFPQTHLLFSFNTYTFRLSERCTLLFWDEIFSHFSGDLDQCFKQNNLIQGPHVTFICWIFVVDPYFSKKKRKEKHEVIEIIYIHKFGISLHLNSQRSNVSTSI